MKKSSLIIALSFFFFSAKAQDIIWLKSGKKIEGSIVSFANKNVRIKIGIETSIYKLDEIKSFQYNGPVEKSNEPAPTSFPVKTSKKQKGEMEARPVKAGK
jgi:hypothetical protein